MVKQMVKQKKSFERFWKSSSPSAAVVGAFTSFMGEAFGRNPKSPEGSPQERNLVQIDFAQPQNSGKAAKNEYETQYSHTLSLRNNDSTRLFTRSLVGIAVDSSDGIYVLGDGEVRIFEPGGRLVGRWTAPEGALCLTSGADERVYFGLPGRVEIYGRSGGRLEGFPVGDRQAGITAVRIFKREVLVADASSRCIRRFDEKGRQLGVIGTWGKNRGFMLPNRALDMDVDAEGVVRATDPGRHRVSSWSLDGAPAGYFGKFGMISPEDFVGCCNPVNLAIAPNGRVVTAEKVAARVKIYHPQGNLLGLIGPEHFDAKFTRLPLAADSKGRIIVADPVRLEVKIFSEVTKSGDV